MDGGTFDRLTRVLTGGMSRRAGIGIALGAVLGRIVGGAEDASAARGANRRHEKMPCLGAGTPCTANDTCCSGRCLPKSGGTGYRCARPHSKAKQGNKKKDGGGGGVPCVSTVCASGCLYTTVEDAYAASAAGSTIYIGTGTYPTQVAITKDMTFDACPGEEVVLEPSRDSLGPDSYYSVFTEDSVASSTPLAVTIRNLTLQGTADGATNADETLVSSHGHGMVSWTIEGCTLRYANIGLYALTREHTVSDCVVSDMDSYGLYLEMDYSAPSTTVLNVNDTTFEQPDIARAADWIHVIVSSAPGSGSDRYELNVTNSSFSGNGDSGSYFEGLQTAGQGTTVATYTNCTWTTTLERPTAGVNMYGGTSNIIGCSFTNGNYSRSAVYLYDASCTLKDTLVDNNDVYYYAAVTLDVEYWTSTLQVQGSTMITNNSSTGSGPDGGVSISMPASGPTASVTGTSTSNVTGNTPNNCTKFVNGSGSQVVSCSTWS